MSKQEMKIRLSSNIRSIANVEINKMNAFFMCGSPTDMPNGGLIRACETYLDAESMDTVTPDIVDTLVKALEKAAVVRPGLLQTGTVRSTLSDIQEVLNNREILYGIV